MKKIFLFLGVTLGLLLMSSCHDHETYADQKKRERTAINKFIADSAIKVISESTFHLQNNTTDVSKNEFVLFESTGIYLQIVRKGCGDVLKNGENTTVLARFDEYNLLTDSLQLTNNVLIYAGDPDKFNVRNTSGTYKASFISGVMMTWYKSSTVPSGWLAPLPYINLGRPSKEGDEIAKVRLIVPHSQGHQSATSGVYPCYYVLTYEKGK